MVVATTPGNAKQKKRLTRVPDGKHTTNRVPKRKEALMQSTTITAEHATLWNPKGLQGTPWSIDVLAQTHQADDTAVLKTKIITLEERSIEYWQFHFQGCTALDLMPVGGLRNRRFTRYEWSSPLEARRPVVLWEVRDSDWLPKQGTLTINASALHHFVVYDAGRNRLWQIAACDCGARRIEPGDALESSEHLLVAASTQR
jgi:hypothetical protein